MAPKLGDTVFVNETDPLTDEDVVSVGVVTYVYSDKDSNGDTGWWSAVKDRSPVQVTVLRRNGTVDSFTTVEGQRVTDDEGRERWATGTYSTTPDGPAQPVQEQTQAAPAQTVPVAQTPPGSPATAADTQSGDQTLAAQSGAQTSTAPGDGGPGWTATPPADQGNVQGQ